MTMTPSRETGGDTTIDLLGADRDLTVIKRSSISNVSALSTSGMDSSTPDDEVVAAEGEVNDILAETERLIEKMSILSKLNANALASVGRNVDPDADVQGPTFSSSDNNNNSSNNDDSKHSEEEAPELNEMLEKAVQLSSMMQSISEHMSFAGEMSTHKLIMAGTDTGYSIATMDHSQHMHMSMSSLRSAARDPDGSSMSDLHHALPKLQASPEPAEMTATHVWTDEASSLAKRSYRQDPPESTGLGGFARMNLTETLPPTPSIIHHRPTSSVNVVSGMNDDDVSSVGSASFRPNNYSQRGERGNLSRHLSSPLRDDLLGVLPSRRMEPVTLSPVASIPDTTLPHVPVCTKIPPADLRANFDVTDSSSPRNSSDGAVQWEKVTTAAPGEDDYVPLVDYTYMRIQPSSSLGGMSCASGSAATAQGSRLERHRKRVEATRKRRLRIASACVIVALFAIIGIYFQNFIAEQRDEVIVDTDQVEEAVSVPVFKSYDTELLQDRDPNNGFCFEAVVDVACNDDHSLMVTFPKFIAPVENKQEEKKNPRRGFFGRFRMK